jgi:DNA-binding IclR family transcriptional regulator
MSRTRDASKSSFATGMRCLEMLVSSPRPLGLSQIAAGLEMAPSSTHDVLHLLRELELVEQRSATRAYTVTPKLLAFAHSISLGYGLNTRIQAYLHAYSVEEYRSVCFCMLAGRESVITYAAGPLCSTVVIGSHGPVYTTAAGKAIVSQLPEEDWPLFAPHEGDDLPTDVCISQEKEFYDELKKVEEAGAAWNRQESETGIYAVAAPLRERDGKVRHAVAMMFSPEDWRHVDVHAAEDEVRALAKTVEGLI